jgi:hypothetical protein
LHLASLSPSPPSGSMESAPRTRASSLFGPSTSRRQHTQQRWQQTQRTQPPALQRTRPTLHVKNLPIWRRSNTQPSAGNPLTTERTQTTNSGARSLGEGTLQASSVGRTQHHNSQPQGFIWSSLDHRYGTTGKRLLSTRVAREIEYSLNIGGGLLHAL